MIVWVPAHFHIKCICEKRFFNLTLFLLHKKHCKLQKLSEVAEN